MSLGRCCELFLARGVRASGGPSSAISVAICSAWPAMRVRRPTSSSRAARSSRAASFSFSSAGAESLRQLLGARLQLVRRCHRARQARRLRGKLGMRALQALQAFRRRCLELRRRLAQPGLGVAALGQQPLGILQRRRAGPLQQRRELRAMRSEIGFILATSLRLPGRDGDRADALDVERHGRRRIEHLAVGKCAPVDLDLASAARQVGERHARRRSRQPRFERCDSRCLAPHRADDTFFSGVARRGLLPTQRVRLARRVPLQAAPSIAARDRPAPAHAGRAPRSPAPSSIHRALCGSR